MIYLLKSSNVLKGSYHIPAVHFNTYGPGSGGSEATGAEIGDIWIVYEV